MLIGIVRLVLPPFFVVFVIGMIIELLTNVLEQNQLDKEILEAKAEIERKRKERMQEKAKPTWKKEHVMKRQKSKKKRKRRKKKVESRASEISESPETILEEKKIEVKNPKVTV